MVLNEIELWGRGQRQRKAKDYWGQGQDNASSRCEILTCELVKFRRFSLKL